MIIRVITIIGYVLAMIVCISAAFRLAAVENKSFCLFLGAAVIIGLMLFVLQWKQSEYSDADD